ncbi:MAG TPA: amino acid permease [Candidatus Acidoferrales bacterium]|nr:amino acid permease [Candidatus Acidoferrales bacterium]
MSENKSAVFVREATGLVKQVSLLDAISINVSDMSAGAALAVVGFTTILLPSMSGVNIAIASLLAFTMLIPQFIIYTMMTLRMPRTGGDYVWVSRALGGVVGNVSALCGYTVGNLPYASLIALSAVFAIGSSGVALGYSNLLGLALPGNVSGADPTSQFLLAAVIVLVLVAINIIKPKAAYKMISAFTVIGIITLVIANSVLLIGGRGAVVNYINSLGIQGTTYDSVASSYSGPFVDWGATLSFVPYFALFTYPWVNAAPALGSEIKGKGTLKWNVPVSAVVAMLLTTSAFATMYYVGGFNFIQGAFANSNLVVNYSFNFWTLAMGVAGNSVISWIIAAGWVLWTVNILAYLIVVEARYLMAQAFDRFLPAKIAAVNRQGSPYVAQIVDFIIIAVMIAGASFFYGTFVSLYGTIVGPMLYFALVGVAAVAYALRHETGKGRIVLVVCGILSAVVFLWLAFQLVSNAAVWGGNTFAYGFLVVTAVVGTAIYFGSKAYYHSKGIDITGAFKEIPPE